MRVSFYVVSFTVLWEIIIVISSLVDNKLVVQIICHLFNLTTVSVSFIKPKCSVKMDHWDSCRTDNQYCISEYSVCNNSHLESAFSQLNIFNKLQNWY